MTNSHALPNISMQSFAAKLSRVTRRGCNHIRPSVLFCAGSAYGIHLLLVFPLRLRRTSFAWREDFLLTPKRQLAQLQTSDGAIYFEAGFLNFDAARCSML